ncbi:MAG: hypothetical protein WBF69_01165 [Castellaniella sp.]|uniref:hypothetical protein n=1 Tax=Castellaniella sp. TaxID=1955812 RepID=UPI003C75E11A
MSPNRPAPSLSHPDWSTAPPDWNWAAQDEDGRWFWYRTEPVPGIGGGVWRANSRNQQYAGQGHPNPDWLESLQQRPAVADGS